MIDQMPNDKKNAWRLFMFYFVLSTAIIVLIGYFGLKTPFNQNEQLKQQINTYNHQKQLINTFSTLMVKTRSMVLDSSNKDTSIVNMQVTDSLKKMQTLVNRDTVLSKKMYAGILTALGNLQQTNQDLRSVSGLDQKINELKDQIDKKNTELNNINTLKKLADEKGN